MLPKSDTSRPFRLSSEQSSFLLFVSLIALTSFAVYFNSLFNGFVFDDANQVLNNPWLKSSKFIPNIFSSNVWGFEGRETSYYRPLMHIIYMLTASVFGLNAWGFHFVNILFHTSVSILVFLIGLRVRDKAIEHFKTAIALKPEDVTFQNHLAKAYEEKKAADANVRK